MEYLICCWTVQVRVGQGVIAGKGSEKGMERQRMQLASHITCVEARRG